MRYATLILYFILLLLQPNFSFGDVVKMTKWETSEEGERYIALYENGWKSYVVSRNDGRDYPVWEVVLENNNVKLSTETETAGDHKPEVVSIELVNICDKKYLISNTYLYFNFDFPSYHYVRHVFSPEAKKTIKIIEDEQSLKAGGLVPARHSKPIHDSLECDFSTQNTK